MTNTQDTELSINFRECCNWKYFIVIFYLVTRRWGDLGILVTLNYRRWMGFRKN